ncbi:uncharacterized protein [Gossypium hirsutum]|uniref:Reverse transcriptase domain-containing protein n=1 Tax=Gossypium hirsutum TaxID=3635 RepID=A0A1U8PW76_GOSHI|nr:uncharacterized protein LOC107963340 [Gossypium hirsutum]
MYKLSNVQRVVDLSWSNSLRHQEFRRKFNKITALRGAYGNWVFDQDTLKSEAVNFFQKLYGEDPGSVGNLPRSAFPGLNSEDVDFLEQNVTNEEIKVFLFDMALFKTPGSDGFQAGFFSELIGYYWRGHMWFSQLRPISLCSVLYKLVMKIIANRFKIIFPKIIGQEQASFIAGRSIIDNVIIAQKVLHSMRVKKSLQWMAIKIDLEKAYDRVLWNGVPTQKFKPVRGIRQGADVVHSGLFTKFLSNFCKISGHKVNARKTNVFFFTGVNISSRNEINDILGFQKVNDLGHYLRVPLFHRRVTKSILDFFVDGVRSRLSSWDAKRLSFARRVTLAHSVLLSIPRYFMQSSLVPKGVFDAIEGLTRQFIWGTVEGKSKIALVKWEDLCQPKISGGLGSQRLWLPEDVVEHIISILPPMIQARSDNLSWSRTTSGVFSVKSAYYALKEESCWAKHFLYTFNEGIDSQQKQLPIRQNSGTYVVLKTDGVVHSVSDLSAAGGKQGYNEVIIRSDNLENVISISESKAGGSKNALIKRRQQILASEENWFLTYVHRETNWVADALAKISLSSGYSLRIFESPPTRVKDILQEDNFADNSPMNHPM